ncbi:hypothetical protein DB891_01970 [Flavobacterium laiguense]|uniref:Uncharacterized protein n=1 Tax=Flavobacterium laiguense TaxID=2169409 RepID=A0A2U1K274_9FLAO|nr:hypothetical protein DB891_01970 [Flavobacterium laiguense]
MLKSQIEQISANLQLDNSNTVSEIITMECGLLNTHLIKDKARGFLTIITFKSNKLRIFFYLKTKLQQNEKIKFF